MTSRRHVILHCLLIVFFAHVEGTVLGQDPQMQAAATEQPIVLVGKLAKLEAGTKSERYVLLDPDGAISSRLRFAPGADVAAYVGAEVGVTAKMLVPGEVPILMAERITPFAAAGEDRLSSNTLSGGTLSSGPVLADIRNAAPTISASSWLEVQPPQNRVSLAAHEEILAPGNVIVDPSGYAQPMGGQPTTTRGFLPSAGQSGYFSGTRLGNWFGGPNPTGQSGACNGNCGNRNCATCVACPCGPPGIMWGRAEYLLWQTSGMATPPLLTTSPLGTAASNAGVLGQGDTQVVFGDDDLFDGTRSGGRFRLGKWCDQCQWIGFEVEYLFLDEERADYISCDLGQPILARPFFNTATGQQDAELVQYPGIVVGVPKIDAESSFYSLSPRFRLNLACESIAECNDCGPGTGGSYRFDMLVGYRYLRLDDSIRFRESLSTIDPTNQSIFNLQDSFDSSNDFHGADLGILWEGYRGPWSLELMGRVGLGTTRQQVRINGSTQTIAGGNTFNDQGGLLALGSNIGSYSRDTFSVIPEVGATLGYSITPRTRLTAGYTFLYWDKVARAGDHIDLNVNPNLIPPVTPNPGQQSPAFAFTETDFWAQGVSLGLDYRW